MSKVIETIVEGFKESTRNAHEITCENLSAEREAAKARHAAATMPHPGMAEFKDAKGVSGKVKAVVRGMQESCQRAKEEQKQRHEDAVHLTKTRELLKEQREHKR